jgi:hypothetical protein
MLQSILEEIEKYNEKVKESSGNNKINFADLKKSWGKEVIPKEYWIDKTKKYKTQNGYEVIIEDIIINNGNGKEVTFPVKGSYIIPRKKGKDKKKRTLWTLDGRDNVLKIKTGLDLIEI